MTIKGTANPPLRSGAELELAFTDLLANGQGVGRYFGQVVFCFGPLPEERAIVRITSIKRSYAVGELVRITLPSAMRTKPFCPVFGECGGCQLQHLQYSAQLAWKRDLVRSALERIGGFEDVRVRFPVGMASPRAYRNKMSLVVDHVYTEPTLGFYRQRSHQVVPIDGCPIVEPALNEIIGRLNGMRASSEVAPAFAAARHIVARTARSSGQSVVTITTSTRSEETVRIAQPLLNQLPTAVGITNSFELSGQNAILGRKHVLNAGVGQIEESIGGVRYRVSVGSFFQVNVEIVGQIFEFMQAGLGQPRKIVDLYSGAGTFSLFFAKHGCEVVGIEENRQAVAEATGNAELNDLTSSVHFVTGKVEQAVNGSVGRAALKEAQIVFLDPPRKGSDEVTLEAIARSGVPNIWYLSCDPATLARDLKFLAANGYRLGVVQPFDMFPQTGHVETLVTLYREISTASDAFADAPIPQWPDEELFPRKPSEYPDFVIRED
ncbi:MAG: 23S rRNA (uracil(1939)-C(5))-methyltransferase RlmD [Candidatus Eremiobacteraeota bacterium]|nr:23S rRNA (uracil(1939)-C(5))-methyltransferase RlmD [Candidatus Eremiobacteraeota bacterium]